MSSIESNDVGLEAQRDAERRKARRTITILATALAVAVVAGGVGAFLAVRGGGSAGGGGSQASGEAVSLDGIVPGQGAARASAHVPGIGVGYQATCAGAGQAAAGWTIQLLAGLTTTTGAAGADELQGLLDEEVLAPTRTEMPTGTDPAASVVKAARDYAAEGAGAAPVNELHAEYGAFKLNTCAEGSSADVVLYAPLVTNGWRANTPDVSEPVEQPIVYGFDMVAVDGEWRIEKVQDLTSAENLQHDGSLDYLEPWAQAAEKTETFQSDQAQEALVGALGVGGHKYMRS